LSIFMPRSPLHRHRLGTDFWRLWWATGFSSFGDGLVLVAFPLLALTLTRRPLLISGVIIAARMPAFVVGLVAGALADRVHRRRLAVAVEWMRLAILAGFAGLLIAGLDSLALVYGVVFSLGCLEELFVAATTASLPSMVLEADLDRANGLLAFSDLTAEEVAGQGLGGVFIALGSSIPFAADAVSFAASAVLLRRSLPDLPVEPATATVRSEVVTGLRWFLAHRALRLMAVVIASFAFCQCIVVAVLVLYLREDLHQSPTGYGLLLAISALGNVVGALLSARLVGRLGAVGAITAAGVIAAAAYLLLGLDQSVVGAGIALALECAAVAVSNVASMSVRQRLIPSSLFGRVGTTVRMVIYAGMPLGALVGGLLGGSVSLPTTFLVAAILQFTVIATVAPRLHHWMSVGAATAASDDVALSVGQGHSDETIDLRDRPAGTPGSPQPELLPDGQERVGSTLRWATIRDSEDQLRDVEQRTRR
jgi:MFS family permease